MVSPEVQSLVDTLREETKVEVVRLREEVKGLDGAVQGMREEVKGLGGEVQGLSGEMKAIDQREKKLEESIANTSNLLSGLQRKLAEGDEDEDTDDESVRELRKRIGPN